ncbi:MAG: C4-dicarboxylate ABC transporter substrate-binding protein [Leptothrix sp. (in: Bacteria)]|nr:C4-dicarboxylate ABC transporter substrate-binding protein [Leptothrix sp. (in: b-proteobacteria)]
MPRSPSPPPGAPQTGAAQAGTRQAGTPRGLGAATLALSSAGPLAQAALLAVAALVLWVAWQVLQPTPDKRLVIATGPEQGAYDDFARRYLPLLQAQGVAVELRATQGSGENLALLRDARSGVQVAFLQGGALAPDAGAPANGSGVVSLGSVAVEPLWLFVRDDSLRRLSKGRPPDRLAALAGWRIATGPPGGGTGLLFRQLAAASGLTAAEPAGTTASTAAAPATGDSGNAVNSVVDLVQGRVDALALVSAAEAPLVRYLLATPGVQLLGAAQAEAYARRFPFLRALTLPRGTIDLAANRPSQDLPLVATTATLAVRADLHPALVQLLLQAAHQVHGQPGWFQRGGDFPQPSADELPLAAAADRYYRNGPPWLQQYLPFWLANFVDRMWIVLLPLLAALLPLSRIVPPLVTLRLRSRVFRWYAHLRDIEAALEAPGADYAALRQRLERLDAQTEHIGLPLSFTNELYDLRGHIHLVRKRLQARAADAPAGAGAADQPAAS